MSSVRRNKKTGAIEIRAYAGKDAVTKKVRNLSETLPPNASSEEIEKARAALEARAAFCKGQGASWTVHGLLAHDLSTLISRGYSPTTVDSYASNLRCYVDPYIGDVPADAVQPYMFASLYKAIMEDGGKDGNPVSRNTARKLHSYLSGAFGRLAVEKILPASPLTGVVAPKLEVVEAEPLFEGDFATLTRHLADHHDTDDEIASLDLSSGVRRGEMSGFQIHDYSLRRKGIHVPRVIAQSKSAGKPWIYKPPKSKAAVRWISLDGEANERVASHIERQAVELAGNGVKQTGKTPLFANPDGSPMLPSAVYSGFVQLSSGLQLAPSVHFHTLRHTHATYLLESGENIRVVQERLGHSSMTVTLQIYGHVLPGRDAAAADSFAYLRNEALKNGRVF